MTNANAPTTREVARDIVFESKDMDEMLTRIASALARERREALERACAVVCRECKDSRPMKNKVEHGYWDGDVWREKYCLAHAIRAEMDKP